jgi:disulfide bond formation protein DsbB
MSDNTGRLARIAALGVPVLLLGGAYFGQYVGGLEPCEMCWWQRYALFVAFPLAVLAWLKPSARLLTALALLAILVGGAIGGYHAGVEYGWWKGATACTSGVSFGGGGDALDALINAPMIPCDVVQWKLFGISLAGWNFLISVPAALLGFAALRRQSAGA